MDTPHVALKDAEKQFQDGKEILTVFKNIDFSVQAGAKVALTGVSGSGKSTLLNVIAGFEPLTAGKLLLNGEQTDNWKMAQWSQFRCAHLGVVFQQFNLLTPLNVRSNIEFPLALNDSGWNDWCDYLVEALELEEILERHVATLSGGQQQRVAIARALAHKPMLLLADEPAGNLDQNAGQEVMKLLTELAEQNKTTLLLVTHSQDWAEFMDAHYHIQNGSLEIRTKESGRLDDAC
ncbi:ABC transporter ATP-binding protein [Vibrio caribbeanicus]|uniref:ABC transporter ATP-binding protein n=1 Tax=Vibrio caribbeanicus TaxID=701175 RepID=UPI0030DA41FA